MRTQSSQLSEKTHKTLSAVRGRRKSVQIWNLLFALLAILLILVSAAMLTDWLLASRSFIFRVFISLSVCGGFLFLARWVWRQLPFEGGLRGTARWLDEVNPALQERLVTMVELSGKDSHSPELLDAVSKQVDLIGVSDHPRRAIFAKPFVSALVAVACAVAMMALVKSISGSGFGTLLGRLVAPWSDRTLTKISPVATPRYHPKGRTFDVAATLSGKIPASATLEYRTAEGAVEEREIPVDRTSGTLQTTLPRMDKNFTYRLTAGDAETPWMEITVIDRPQLQEVKLVITPPSYTKLEERVWTTLPRRVEVPQGSKVSLSFTAEPKLPGAKIIQRGDQKEQTANLLPDERGRFQFDSTPTDSVEAEIQLTSVVGDLQSRFPITLAVKLDDAPQVRLLDSTETFAMTADETLDVAFQATDDYGIKSAELVAEVTKADGSKKEFRFPLDLQGKAGDKDLKVTASLDLKKIPLAKGDDLQFAVEVRDDRRLQASHQAEIPEKQDLLASEKNAANDPAKQGSDDPDKANLAKNDDKQPSAPKDGKTTPETTKNEVEKRKLDLAKTEPPAAKSAAAKVTVDALAEYRIAGDGRKKQQIAIQEVLDRILKSAVDGRTGIALTGSPPKLEKDPTLAEQYSTLVATKAPEIQAALRVGAEGAEELRKRSEGTPYSFFGLQAKALVETGFAPAFEAITQAVTSAVTSEKAKHLLLADERLRWVISQLAKNKQQFEKMIEFEEVLELAHQFKKMHEVTVEDMPPSSCCRSGPYAKLKNELSDAAVMKKIAGLKLKREVLKRLSELLQKNPELRARHLAKSSESSKIYREELSRLRNRQQDFAEAAAQLSEVPSQVVSQPLSDMIRQRLLKFSSHTTEVLGLARIWIPTATPPALRQELESALGILSQTVEQLAKANPLLENEFEPSADAVRAAGVATVKILSKPEWKTHYSDYSSYRDEDLAGMSTELDACTELAKSLRSQKDHLFLSQLQKELNTETQSVTLGMMDELGAISGVSPVADKTIEELAKLLSERLYPTQKQAFDSFAVRDTQRSLVTTTAVVADFEKATRLLDSAITEFIRAKTEQDALAKQADAPGQVPQPSSDPTEDQIKEALADLLRAMEEESRESSSTKLGIAAESNLKIKNDWEKESKDEKKEKSEKEALAQQRQKQMQAAQQAASAAGKAQQIANAKAKQIAQEMGQKPGGPWREQGIAQLDGRNNWNTIQSQLKESLTQEIDTTVPEEYRTAIEGYFRDISETRRP